MPGHGRVTRRSFLKGAAAAAMAAPYFVPDKAFGANDKIAFAGIGMGGQGRGDLGGFLGFRELQTVAVCDVAKDSVPTVIVTEHQSRLCVDAPVVSAKACQFVRRSDAPR